MDAIIHIKDAFSEYPGTRYKKHGQCSGEEFRDDYLVKWLRKYPGLVLDFSGVLAVSPSFLDEAFGGLVTKHGFTKDDLLQRLTIKSNDNFINSTIWDCINEAEKYQ